jgi:two-component system, NtrC family, sensor kinase
MMPSPSSSAASAGFERFSLTLFAGGVAAAMLLLSVIPMPANSIAHALTVVAILAAVAGSISVLWRRHFASYHAAVSSRLEHVERELGAMEGMASVGRVAAGIAHEVGNPLTGIANYAHVLRSRMNGSPDVESALQGIDHEVDRIDRIVGGLLDYARPQKGPPSAFDAAAKLREAVELLATQGVFRSVQVQSTIPDAPLPVVGNAQAFEQAFVNVLLNAIDAMNAQGTLSVYAGQQTAAAVDRPPKRRSGDGAGASTVERPIDPKVAEWRAQHETDEPCAKFVVADSGPGVKPDDAGRIFDPFFTTKSRAEGSGLGLAIVQRVVDSHGGVVWVQRAREGGAAFHMVLPLSAFDTAPDRIA